MHYTDNVPFILSTWIIVTGVEIRNIHMDGFTSYTIYSHCLFILEEACTTMIIAHSTGEEVIVLCTSTIIFSYLVNYIDSIHFVISEIIETVVGRVLPLKNDHDSRFLFVCHFTPSTMDKFSIKMPRGFVVCANITLRSYTSRQFYDTQLIL